MNTREIAKRYNINQSQFEQYMMNVVGSGYEIGLLGFSVGEDIDEHVLRFKQYLAENDDQIVLPEPVDPEKQAALDAILITSGYNFEGYKITKYAGYISGDDSASLNRGSDELFSNTTDVSEVLTDSLVKIRKQALKELREAAYEKGCNAIIGVDFDYITIDPKNSDIKGKTVYLPYIFCVTANGNAVVIEKE